MFLVQENTKVWTV